MSSNPIYEYIASAAVSLTMAGNTGISPFLTLFLLGVLEMARPEWLNMGPTMEMLLASWWSIGILGSLTVAEMVGKCIPAVDEAIDSVEVFVVPAISILATLATTGMLPLPPQDDAGLGQAIDVGGIFGDDSGGDRYLLLLKDNETTTTTDPYNYYLDDDGEYTAFSEGFMAFTKVALVAIGMGLALAVHLFKMLVRVSSLMCSGGCCQPCITVVEYVLVVVGVVLAILAPVVAIIASLGFIIASGYVVFQKCCNHKTKEEDNSESKEQKATTTKNSANTIHRNNNNNNNNDDEENQSTPKAVTAEFVENHNTPNPPAEAFAIATDDDDDDGFEDVPLPPLKLDVEAKPY